jgi:phosphodiesterase/alkaline phosphatase D-like protein
LPQSPDVALKSVLSVGDSIGGYRMVGIPDGLGAFDNGNGTFTLLMNQELGSTLGATRAHGAKGAFVSKWVINKGDLSVLAGSDLMQQVYLWDTSAQQSSNTPSAFAFTRFCSGDLPAQSAYYNAASGLGTQERIYMHGEEGGATGYQLASVVTGPDAGKSYVLGKFNLSLNGSGLTGVGAWENALANPFPQDKTVVMGNTDGGTGLMNNTVSVYQGTKQSTGSEVEKAGLVNGVLKFIAVTGFADGSGTTIDEFSNTTTHANIIPQGTRFTLDTNTATTFSRPEDGAWNPLNPRQYYFVTTDRLDTSSDGVGTQVGQTRLWRLTFDDITNPDAGGIIECLIDGQTVGGQKANMFDNITVNKTTGHLILLEDVGNAVHNGKVWEYDPATFTGVANSGALTMIAKHDPARFGDIGLAATSPFNQDEETSGVIDTSAILGAGTCLLVDQAHYLIDATHNVQGFGNPDELVEGGQLMLLRTGVAGSIGGAAAQTVSYGADGTAVTAVPATGYHFVQWSDGATTNPRSDLNVTSNVNVTASFAINTYTLNYTPGANGTISGANPQTVNYGANGTPVTAVAESGYQFIGWSDSSTVNPRTDANVTANISVTASFATAPTILSPTRTGITSTGATLGGNVSSDGGSTIIERGVVYSISSVNNNPALGGAGVTKVGGAGTTGVFTVNVVGLSPNTTYSFKAYAINAAGTSYTTPVSILDTLASVTFLGVAAGDVSGSDAVIWTRATDDTQPGSAINLTLQYSIDNTFATGVSNVIVTTMTASLGDNTAKQIITGLTPATRYYYRFVGSGGEISNLGTFKTAPAANAAAALHFGFSGDLDGLMRPYALAGTVPAQGLDFYLNCGDVIYENASAVVGNNGASWLNSPSVTLSGASAGSLPSPGTTFATRQQLFNDYNKKYREQFLPVNTGGQNCLKDFYAGQGNYTLSDNHELGNRQYINGGAPAGGSVGGPTGNDMPTGQGVNARGTNLGDNANDAADPLGLSGGLFMNMSQGYQTLQQVFLNYQPVKENRTTATVSGDNRTGTTRQLFFSQQWGRNALYIQTDARSYRDIRLKTSTGAADDCGPRGDNTNRTYLGATQLAWLEQQLLTAETNGTPWKFVAVSDPIDQIGPISQTSGIASLSTITGVNSDGGKSYIGGYRAERNALLKFIADHGIKNVVFLATDDHQNRINEVLYATNGITGPGTVGAGTQAQIQAGYTKVPYCFSIVCGPLGATGPETITDHSFANIQAIANDLATKQAAAGVEPIGLLGYPGLHDVMRDTNGVLVAETTPQAADFYSPDTFNYNILDVSADGRTLTVISKGINSTAQNSATEYGVAGNTVRTLFSFQIDAPVTTPVITGIQVFAGNVLIDFTGGPYDGTTGFTVMSTADLSTPMTPIAAGITTSAPGQFRATVPVGTPAAFYRIKR